MNEDKNSASETTYALMIFLVALIFLVPFLWEEYIRPYYITAWYYLKLGVFHSLYVITSVQFFEENIGKLLFWMDWFIVDMYLPSEIIYGQILEVYSILLDVDTTSPDTISKAFLSYGEIDENFQLISRFGFAVLAPFYVYLGFKMVRVSSGKPKYDKVYSLDSFAEDMSEGFPELLPVVWDNPQNYDINKGHWRMSPRPKAYLEENGCIEDFEYKGEPKFRLKREEALILVEEQLGRQWEGFSKLTMNEKRILALTLPMLKSPSKGVPLTNELIREYGYAFSKKPGFKKRLTIFTSLLFSPMSYMPNFKMANTKGLPQMTKLSKQFGCLFKNQIKLFSAFTDIRAGIKEDLRKRKYLKSSNKKVNQIIRKNKDLEELQSIIDNHAYVSTVLSRCVDTARQGGTLPACSCLFLKPIDRQLYYIFNNVGRNVSWVETTGWFAHYIAEKRSGFPFPYPKVEAAVDGMDEYLWASYYEYEPYKDWEVELAPPE
ncbi:hypothetical protein ACQKQC_18525 [Vibrio fortis]|uniref:secretion/conjugation apparatus DotM-related subunit n=1 Tax=Vibrio fortis TaxID=212667 RepID=UPI004067A3A5